MIGALAMYMFDRERGRRRRHMLRDRLRARVRRMRRSTAHLERAVAAEIYGDWHRIAHRVPRTTTGMADDETLCQRVESQLFRDPRVHKGDLNINCEHGMVILRGEVDRSADIADLDERVRRIPGVRGVENLLHPRGTPAPNKERSRVAG
jgi:osmotically-inducible protein OsmY